ncbi:hypothetical protein [Clostridium sp. AN503]|uniref:hypothetical protein n=1 Tax=Clostridium sp. AN503 TaxID=3160598 RepID=UPI00345A89BA
MRQTKIIKIAILAIVFYYGAIIFHNFPKASTDYIVVSASDIESGAHFPYVLSKNHGVEVLLVGKCPEYELSYIFLEKYRNKFRVYGEKNEILSKEYGCLVWNATDWEILAPIKRDYDALDWEMRQKHRYFASIFSFDKYDKNCGDYKPILYDNIRMGYYEISYWLKQKGYFLISPLLYNGAVEWNLINGEHTRNISVIGSNPSDFFNDEIINITQDDIHQDGMFRNYFVVKGFFNNENELFIDDWWLCVPFTRFNSVDKSVFGFTEEDIEKGIFINKNKRVK